METYYTIKSIPVTRLWSMKKNFCSAAHSSIRVPTQLPIDIRLDFEILHCYLFDPPPAVCDNVSLDFRFSINKKLPKLSIAKKPVANLSVICTRISFSPFPGGRLGGACARKVMNLINSSVVTVSCWSPLSVSTCPRIVSFSVCPWELRRFDDGNKKPFSCVIISFASRFCDKQRRVAFQQKLE